MKTTSNQKNIKLPFFLSVGMILMISTACNTQKDTTASSQEPQERTQRERSGRLSVEEIFSSMDANEDGKLAKEEVQGPLERDFSRIDQDGDGFISKTELENAPRPPRGQGGRPQNN